MHMFDTDTENVLLNKGYRMSGDLMMGEYIEEGIFIKEKA